MAGKSGSATALSRTGTASPLGKCEYEIHVRLPNSVGPLWEAFLKAAGYTADGECARDVLLVKLLGKTLADMTRDSRRELLKSEVPFAEQMRSGGGTQGVGQ